MPNGMTCVTSYYTPAKQEVMDDSLRVPKHSGENYNKKRLFGVFWVEKLAPVFKFDSQKCHSQPWLGIQVNKIVQALRVGGVALSPNNHSDTSQL